MSSRHGSKRTSKAKPKPAAGPTAKGNGDGTTPANPSLPAAGVDPVARAMRDHPGSWIAWRESQRTVLAIADTAAELLEHVPEREDPDVVISVAPGIHPHAAARPFQLLADEPPNILDDVK